MIRLGFTILYIVDYRSSLWDILPTKKTCSYGYESKRGTRMVSYDSRLDVYSTFFPQIPGEMGLTYGPYVFINKTLEFYPIPGYPPVKKPLENQLLQLYQSKIIYIYMDCITIS